MAKKSRVAAILFAFVSIVGATLVMVYSHQKGKHPMNTTIEVYVPFVFSEKLDPRSIFTVGDQILSEHLFGFHAKTDPRAGFSPVLSEVSFTPGANTVRVHPHYPLFRSDGSKLKLTEICENLRECFQGTRHAPYGPLLKKVDCTPDGDVEIALTKTPVNLRFLFTTPDFSIYDASRLPLSKEALHPTTGPYYLTEFNRDKMVLKPNPFYPKSLTANQVETVHINRYAATDVSTFVANTDPSKHHLLYFFGYSITEKEIAELDAKKYHLQRFPSEWLIHLGFHPSVDLNLRRAIGEVIDKNRNSFMPKGPLGVPAFSIPPSDRPFGLTETEYQKAVSSHQSTGKNLTPQRKLKLATLKTWAKIPFFEIILSKLSSELPYLEITLLEPGDIGKLFSPSDVDLYLAPIGISTTDPLSHLSFLADSLPLFGQAVSKDEVIRAAIIDDATVFDQEIKKIETKILDQRILIPIAHFPGVVAEAENFERNADLAWSWGIQTWTYRIR